MRPIPATRPGDAPSLLRARNIRRRLRTDEYGTEFTRPVQRVPGE